MPTPITPTRYGFYYYPDTLHYQDNDIISWIPELQALNASWLTLLAPLDRMIPESFIRTIIDHGIQPVIHMPLPTQVERGIEPGELFTAYASLGIRYLVPFDRPNLIRNWSPSNWARNNLVERFLDLYIPVAETARQAGLIPGFPPLEPGGDYWDTAFLYSALQGLQRRGLSALLDQLVLTAYAWPGNRSPNWGAGGPERWPQTRPYQTPQNSEDHLGFRIFDWYLAICNAALGVTRPILLLGAGSRIGDQPDPNSPAVDVHAHTWQNMTLVRLMSGPTQDYDPIPPEVLACNFWLLSASAEHPEIENAWYRPDHSQLPIVQTIKDWVANRSIAPKTLSKMVPASSRDNAHARSIDHYLLLPTREWGEADWHLDAIRPFITKYQPTVGFSPHEASHAKKVTIFGGLSQVPDAVIDDLLAAGCIVEQISGDGMDIASQSLPKR